MDIERVLGRGFTRQVSSDFYARVRQRRFFPVLACCGDRQTSRAGKAARDSAFTSTRRWRARTIAGSTMRQIPTGSARYRTRRELVRCHGSCGGRQPRAAVCFIAWSLRRHGKRTLKRYIKASLTIVTARIRRNGFNKSIDLCRSLVAKCHSSLNRTDRIPIPICLGRVRFKWQVWGGTIHICIVSIPDESAMSGARLSLEGHRIASLKPDI